MQRKQDESGSKPATACTCFKRALLTQTPGLRIETCTVGLECVMYCLLPRMAPGPSAAVATAIRNKRYCLQSYLG